MQRRISVGVVDQIVSSGTSFVIGLAAAAVLSRDEFGLFAAGLAATAIVGSVGRGIVGDVALTYLPSLQPARAIQAAGTAISCSIALGMLSASVLFGLSLFPLKIFDGLAAFALCMPLLTFQDACRYIMIARGDIGVALKSDGTWLLVQCLLITGIVAVGPINFYTVFGSWAAGLGVATIVILIQAHGLFSATNPLIWFRQTRHFSGWFSSATLLGQCQSQLVVFVVGAFLSPAAVAGIRVIQLLILQPIQTVLTALTSVLVPTLTRKLTAREYAQFSSLVSRLTRLGCAAGLVLVLLVPLGIFLITSLFPQYEEFNSLVPPVAIQAALLCVYISPVAALRAGRFGAPIFKAQLLGTLCTLGSVLLASIYGDANTVAWSLMGAYVVLAGSFVLAYRRSTFTSYVEESAGS
ncbi:hypothetical protein [Actinomycetospora chiangmaiensis]|uniref:hypothetical protein n=1 Tax=Actinomycetospora chiangmaiensis TaxID=402650 RepID=UPI0012FC0FEA|nr:hypothetical protein [Actinomycetospora chiangmaiensis]